MMRYGRTSLVISVVSVVAPAGSAAQQIQGRIVDALTGQGIQTANVLLLDENRVQLAVSIADNLGNYVLSAPEGGSYYLSAERLGYYDTESVLVTVVQGRRYQLDLELSPQPILLDPLLVSVSNEEMERWFRLRLGGDPRGIFGYRAIQGVELAEVKAKSKDNTALLRWLYVPVSHGLNVCIGYAIPEVNRSTMQLGPRTCGKLYLDGNLVLSEHIESIDMESIAVVVKFGYPPAVHLFTSAFNWSGRTPR